MADEQEEETKEEAEVSNYHKELDYQKELEDEMNALDDPYATVDEEVVEEEEEVEEEEVAEDEDGQEKQVSTDGQEKDGQEKEEELEEEEDEFEEEEADLDLDSDIAEVVEPNALLELKKQNELLLARVDELTGNQQAPEKEVEAKLETPPTVSKASSDSVPDYIGSRDLEEILDSKEKFNSLLHSVIATHAGDIIQKAVEESSLALPNIVSHQLSQQTYNNNMAKTFYKEHEDLSIARQTVATQFNEVMAENPNADPMSLLDEIANRSRKIVGLPLRKNSVKVAKKAPTAKRVKVKKPALGGSKRRSKRPSNEKMSELDKDMMELDT